MSKKEKDSPVVVVWWKLITILVMFAIAFTVGLIGYNIYMKSIGGQKTYYCFHKSLTLGIIAYYLSVGLSCLVSQFLQKLMVNPIPIKKIPTINVMMTNLFGIDSRDLQAPEIQSPVVAFR